jgi:hypothetical protein
LTVLTTLICSGSLVTTACWQGRRSPAGRLVVEPDGTKGRELAPEFSFVEIGLYDTDGYE